MCYAAGMGPHGGAANRVKQLYQSNANQHVRLIQINFCEDTRPGPQLEAAQQQHATYYTKHTINQSKQLMLVQDMERANKLSRV
eukprot:309389-Pelagomonas_calceolata.AAC.1